MVKEVHALEDLTVPIALALEVCIEDGKVYLVGLTNDKVEFIVRTRTSLAIRARRDSLIKVNLDPFFTAMDGARRPSISQVSDRSLPRRQEVKTTYQASFLPS